MWKYLVAPRLSTTKLPTEVLANLGKNEPLMKFRNNNNKKTKLEVRGVGILKKMKQNKIYKSLKI